ncbi:MAG TPA: hypothetical protein VLA90_10120 [Actinomycetota bacterium]|nr:hypothetical protein [Actinomycetota bacterium]
MVPRILIGLMVAALVAFVYPAVTSAEGLADDDVVLAREEDAAALVVSDDDDDRDDNGTDDGTNGTKSFTSGVESNDGTNSRVTSVSRGDDRSRGDLTRDRTKDGPGTSTRDRTANSTNDRTRNDTR